MFSYRFAIIQNPLLLMFLLTKTWRPTESLLTCVKIRIVLPCEWCSVNVFRLSKWVFLAWLWLTLYDLMECSPQGFPTCGIFLKGMLEWVANPPLVDFPNPGIKPKSVIYSALTGGFFTTSANCQAGRGHLSCSLLDPYYLSNYLVCLHSNVLII